MKRTIYVTCPCCETSLEVDAENGHVINQWKKTLKEGGQDVLTAGLKKIQEDKEKRKDLFKVKQEEMAKKKKESEEAFKKKLEDAKKEGPQKPTSPFDLD